MVAFTVVLIFAGAAAATLGRRIVQWVLRTTQGVPQAMFRFMQRVFVPLRRLASPALRRRIFGRNWSGWLRRRFGVGARDLLGRRRTRIGNENHELGLIRHLDGNVTLAICSDRCQRLIGLLEEIKPFQRPRRQRAIQRLTDDIRDMQQAARNGQNISGRFNSVQQSIRRLVDDDTVREDLLAALRERFPRRLRGRIHVDDNVAWNPRNFSDLDANGLPRYNQRTTYGRLEVEGRTYRVRSVEGEPGIFARIDPSIPAGAVAHTHAEGHAAMIMRLSGARRGTIWINNLDGPCDFCERVLRNILPENSTLVVRWPGGSRPYTGNIN